MKKWVDKKRRLRSSRLGTLCLLRCPTTLGQAIIIRVSLIAMRVPSPSLRSQGCKLTMRPKIKYHPVFHVGLLKPYHGDERTSSRGISQRALMGIKMQHDNDVEEILVDQVCNTLSNHQRINSLSSERVYLRARLVGSPSKTFGNLRRRFKCLRIRRQ